MNDSHPASTLARAPLVSRTPRRRWLAALGAAGALAALPGAVWAQELFGPLAGVEPCQSVTFGVALHPGEAATHPLVGERCGVRRRQHQTLQILVHGATYNHTYWDWLYQPECYSHARYAHAAGFATLAVDGIGAGASDHPVGYDVTVTDSAYTPHHVIGAVRAGFTPPGGHPTRLDRVIYVGHSFGAFIGWYEAETYADIDGLVINGASHDQTPPGAAVVGGSVNPAEFDPRFATAGFPSGYFTTIPGTRGADFHCLPGADPAIVAQDEATKQVLPIGLFCDQFIGAAHTDAVHVPALWVEGDEDALACEAPSCSATHAIDRERPHYAADACLTGVLIPNAGHELNLHDVAPLWFATAQTWALTRVGDQSNEHAPFPCR